MKRFVFNADVEGASGYQQFYVDAENLEQAREKLDQGGADIYSSEVDVTSLGDFEFDMETTVDDFGDAGAGDVGLRQQRDLLLAALEASLPIWEEHKLDVSEASILIDCRNAINAAKGAL